MLKHHWHFSVFKDINGSSEKNVFQKKQKDLFIEQQILFWTPMCCTAQNQTPQILFYFFFVCLILCIASLLARYNLTWHWLVRYLIIYLWRMFFSGNWYLWRMHGNDKNYYRSETDSMYPGKDVNKHRGELFAMYMVFYLHPQHHCVKLFDFASF